MGEKDNVKYLERQIKGRPVYIILLFTFIIAIICLLVYIGLIITTKYQIGVGKEYELFRDILAIFLTILGLAMAVLGYEIYHRILKHAEISMKEREEDFISFSTAMLFLNLGFFHWQHYENGCKVEGKEENKQNDYALHHKNLAINLTKTAYDKVLILDESERRNEQLKCQIMNNFGYYLAKEGEEKDKYFSKKCAYYIIKRLDKFPDKRDEWQDTFDFIIKKYGPANQFELE